MNTRLVAKYPPEVLYQIFKSQKDLQDFLMQTEYEYVDFKSQTMSQYAEDGMEQTEYQMNLKMIDRLNKEIPIYRRTYNELPPESANKKSAGRKVESLERELERALDKHNKYTARSLFNESLDDHANHSKIEAIDILIDHIGGWFEEGHLGAGTVEFMGRKFTAQ